MLYSVNIRRKKGSTIVYRKSLYGKRCCSWCDFSHEDFKVVVDHENEQNGGGKKE